MKIKTLIGSLLAAALVAGCASEKSEDSEQQARLATQAKITRADAEKTALARVPNGTVKEGELEKEHGKLIWSFDIAVPASQDITEVAVDAISGDIVSVETEKPERQKEEKD